MLVRGDKINGALIFKILEEISLYPYESLYPIQAKKKKNLLSRQFRQLPLHAHTQ